jgi:cytochrome c
MILSALLVAALLTSTPNDPAPPPPPGEILAPVPMPESPIERRGRLVGLQCGGCHNVKPGESARIGPSLVGIVGAKAGVQPGFYYSPALRDSGLVWDRPTLDRYLSGPQRLVPGTKMQAGAVLNLIDREAVLAWLESLGK